MAHLHARLCREVGPQELGIEIPLAHTFPPGLLDPRGCMLSFDFVTVFICPVLLEDVFCCLHVGVALECSVATPPSYIPILTVNDVIWPKTYRTRTTTAPPDGWIVRNKRGRTECKETRQ